MQYELCGTRRTLNFLCSLYVRMEKHRRGGSGVEERVGGAKRVEAQQKMGELGRLQPFQVQLIDALALLIGQVCLRKRSQIEGLFSLAAGDVG